MLIVGVALAVAVAVAASTLYALHAYVTAVFPAATPHTPAVDAGAALPVVSDPTAGTLSLQSVNSADAIAAEAAARAALRTDGDSSGNGYSRGLAASAVGQVFGPHSQCTATMVESRSGRVAVTAAHCLYWPAAAAAYYGASAYDDRSTGSTPLTTFTPGRAGDRLPYGKWPIEGAWVDPVWRHTGDPRYDVAFLRLGTREGLTPQRVLGAEGVVFDGVTGGSATVLGYPARPPFDGTSLRRCTTPATTADPRRRTIELRCRLNGGSSGGPWLADFNADTGRGAVMAVTGYNDLYDDVLGGERLGVMARRLYTEADTDAPHR